jgi:ABC-type multidrug transport system ATPase subunit
MAAIEVRDIRKDHAGEHALAGVSLAVAPGSLYGLIGADGAGKTTLMRILTTLTSADSGSATVLGRDVARDAASLRAEIGYMPQRFSLYQDLSVAENLHFFADVFNVTGRELAERLERLLAFSRLEPFLKRRAGQLSGGMKQKLALACALIHTPAVLFLDEPTAGVDPVSRSEFWDILAQLRRQGMTILTSTPYMDEAMLCDELLLLHKGQVLQQGAPAVLLAAYPYALYAVSSSSGALSFPHDQQPPEGIVLMYPSAGELHVAVAARDSAPESVLAAVRSVVPAAERIRLQAPSIDDLVLCVLSAREQAA